MKDSNVLYFCVTCKTHLPNRRGGRKYCERCVKAIKNAQKKYHLRNIKNKVRIDDISDWLDYS